jgi:thiol-disulfide isomerase/thioredoxin
MKFGNDHIFDMANFDKTRGWMGWLKNEFSHRLSPEPTPVVAGCSASRFTVFGLVWLSSLGLLHNMKGIICLMLVYAISSVAFADDEKAQPMVSGTDKLVVIQQEYKEAKAAYYKARQSLPDTPDGNTNGQELLKKFEKKEIDLFMAAVELARANPKSEVGFSALEWVINTVTGFALTSGPPTLEIMTSQYAENPKIGKVVAVVSYYLPEESNPSHAPAVALLSAAAEKNPDRTARGQAALGLAWLAKHKFQQAELKGNPDANELAAQAEQAFESVLRNYGDCPNLRTVGVRPATSTLGGEAEPELYELRHLRVGQAAPEIEGEDLDGTGLKLSSYRGKVILLVFWASWCGPCMSAVPQEKSLVEHFKSRPFVMIGVNCDGSKTAATKTVVEHQISWRSFWNGKEGPGGPIAVAWNVRGWPTVYVLDQQGVIRYKNVIGKQLDDSLEKLVSAAEKQ